MKSKSTYIAIVLLAIVYSSSFSQSNKEAQINKLEKMEMDAIQKQDTLTLLKVWSKDLIVNNPYGVIVTTPQIVSLIRKGEIDYSHFERIQEKIIFTENLAIAMGHEIVVGQNKTQHADEKIVRRYTHVWIKTKSSWQLLARQASNFPAH